MISVDKRSDVVAHPYLQPKPLRLDEFNELLADAPEDERWELLFGRVIRMMGGARWEHAQLVSNLHFGLRRRLEAAASPCRVFTETFRVEIDAVDSSLMPDITVFCSPLAPGATSLSHPKVLMEILSRGTAYRHGGERREAYQRLPSLRHHALVEQAKPAVHVFDRHEESWSERHLDGLGASLELPALDVAIPLAEIYADVFA